MSSSPEVQHVAHICDLTWPQDAIFLVDDALPREHLNDLPRKRILFLPAGEDLKSLHRIGEVAEEVLALRTTRPLTLVAIGGGSLGDAAGFLASILWRGVALWHVPTTLLAMVDSAHGGKTALNLGGRKNQLGTFYPADKVIIARSFLHTLPYALREEGFAELLKALWLGGSPLLSRLDDLTTRENLLGGDIDAFDPLWEELLTASIEIKNRIVAQDPFEKSGLRRILNFGHTAGHGLEALYRIPHGRAVAWGMAAAAFLSVSEGQLPPAERDRLLMHLEPLLIPLPDHTTPGELKHFRHLLSGDKKQVDGKLISILLNAPGDPQQVNQISPDQWWNASRDAYQWWRTRPLRIKAPAGKPIIPPVLLPADKSQANRLAIIEALRPGPTLRHLPPCTPSADIADMNRCVAQFQSTDPHQNLTLFTGEGGTVGRFLMALAATRPGRTELIFAEGLRTRPHDALAQALRDAGAKFTKTDQGYLVHGFTTLPDTLSVDASLSSQYASALALLAAAGHSFHLRFHNKLVSRPYFEMTLSLLQSAGVTVTEHGPDHYSFAPRPELSEPWEVAVSSDTSASVVWRILAARSNHPYDWPPENPEHPDHLITTVIRLLLAASPESLIKVDLADAPDLAPCLAAFAALIPPGLLVTGASHLHHKESNRILDLKASLREVDIHIEDRPDGFFVPSGIQAPNASHPFDARGDHRLAMAGLILTTAGHALILPDAQAVRKSYPDLWRHARQRGFSIAPYTGSLTRNPS